MNIIITALYADIIIFISVVIAAILEKHNTKKARRSIKQYRVIKKGSEVYEILWNMSNQTTRNEKGEEQNRYLGNQRL